MPIEYELISGDAAFDQLADDWDRLAHGAITDTPFQKLAYQRSWWRHLGSGELYTVAVRDAGQLIGIGSFFKDGDSLLFNGSKEESDYLDIITGAADAARVWQQIFACLCTDVPQWTRLDLWNIPAQSPSRELVATEAAQRGFSIASELAERCPVISLPSTFDDYLEMLDGKQRHEIRRKLRRSQGAEARLIEVDSADSLTQRVDQFLDLLQKSTPQKAQWLNEGRRNLFHDVAQAALADGTLQLLFIEMDGQLAASLFNFDYQDRIWVYNSGLDPEAFARLGFGVVLTALSIELAIERGRQQFDFLRGDETYKYRFGATATDIYRLTLDRAAAAGG